MNWRAPWLKDRSLPLLLALLDAVVIASTYGLVAKIRTGLWTMPGNGGAFATFCWIVSSYIAGRYSSISKANSKSALRQTLMQALAASAIVWIGFIAHSWIYQVVDAQTRFRGFLVPVLTVIGGLGVCSRMVFLRIGKTVPGERWLMVCSKREEGVLRRELKESELSQAEFCSIEKVRDIWSEGANIVIGEDISPKEIEFFYFASLRAGGTRVSKLTDWCEIKLNRIPSELIDERWFLLGEGFAIQPGRIWWRVKRIGDVLAGLLLGIVTLPVVAIACCAIWLEDKGPMFYGQERTGIYGTRIRIWKLRSMKVNAEKHGPMWSKQGDKRITRIGRLIRKTRIDELPQLWSVVNGDLSLIGPRPERPKIEEELEREISNYRTREWIRPGLSGWAQVSYPYGASISDSRTKLSYDLYYLKNAGFLMDILIVLKTIRLIVRAEGSVPQMEKNS